MAKNVAQALEGKQKLAKVSGIHYREHDGIKSGKKPEIVGDLDSIPFPARHLVDKYDYGKVNNTYLFRPKLTSMVTSRGCPFQCRFCSRHALSYNTYRQRSAENVMKEIQEINDTYGSVYIVDDNFLADKRRAHTIMDSLIADGTDIDILIAGARVDSAEPSLYSKMKKANVKYVEFGIESRNQNVLDYYNKGVTLNQIRDAVKLSRKMDFITVGNFILGAPMETKKHIKQTMKFASSLPLDIALFYPLMYTYGSDLWNEAVQNNNINDDDDYSVITDSEKGLGYFTGEEVMEMCHKSVKKFYMRPKYFFSQIYRSVKRGDFSILKIGMNYV